MPAGAQLNSRYVSEKKGKLSVVVYAGLGRLVQTRSYEETQPVFQTQLNLVLLKSGYYFIAVRDEEGTNVQGRFIRE